jgi:hypothetical protein
MDLIIESRIQAIQNYFNALEALYENGVLLNKKDFTGQLGEWLVETIYGGERAKSGIQKGWDIKVKDRYIQVKTHSKAEGNKNRWSAVEKESSARVDELIIVVFTHNYKLVELFKVPWNEAINKVKPRGVKSIRNELNWNDLKSYSQDLSKLPNQKVVSLFKE